MGLAMFYHLTRSGSDDVARSLIQRCLGQGWRVMVRGRDRAGLERLDGKLWLGPEEEFLAHGLQGGPQDGDQPVLIGTGPVGNGAQALMLVEGAEPLPGEMEALERAMILFDGNDEAALQGARGQWVALTKAGHKAQYWSEESGRWEKKRETGE